MNPPARISCSENILKWHHKANSLWICDFHCYCCQEPWSCTRSDSACLQLHPRKKGRQNGLHYARGIQNAKGKDSLSLSVLFVVLIPFFWKSKKKTVSSFVCKQLWHTNNQLLHINSFSSFNFFLFCDAGEGQNASSSKKTPEKKRRKYESTTWTYIWPRRRCRFLFDHNLVLWKYKWFW